MRAAAEKVACINNLRQIDNAKEQWAVRSNNALGDALHREHPAV